MNSLQKHEWWVGVTESERVYDTLISNYSLATSNSYLDLNFDFGVYNADGSAVTQSSLVLTFAANGGTATNVTIASITNNSGGALVGGETTIRVNLTITGSISGTETIEVTPSGLGVIKDTRNAYNTAEDTTSAILLNYTYDDAWQDVLDYAQSEGIPIPDQDHNILASQAIAALKSNSIWTEIDAAFAYFLCHESIAFSLINIKAPGVGLDSVQSGVPTWTPHEGVKSGGGAYVNSKFKPATHGVKFTQDSASVIVHVYNNASANGTVMVGAAGDGGANANIGNVQVGGRRNDDDVQVSVNRNGGAVTLAGGVTTSAGVHHLNRTASNLIKFYVNNTLINTSASVSTSPLTDLEMYVCGKNANGTFGSADTNHNIGFVAFGSNLDSKTSEINTIITDWVNDTHALPYTPTPLDPDPGGVNRLYMIIGQSNADGRGFIGDLPGNLQGQLGRCYVWRSGIWEILEEGVNANNGLPYSKHGFMLSLAYEERIKHPLDILYFINEGIGATPLYNKWKYSTGANYIQALSTFDDVIATGKTFTKEALLWWQGEGDTGVEAYANAYEADEQDTINGMIAHTGFGQCVAVNISGSTSEMPYIDTVRAAKVANAAASLYTLIDSEPYNPTLQTHIDSAGQVSIGEDISAEL